MFVLYRVKSSEASERIYSVHEHEHFRHALGRVKMHAGTYIGEVVATQLEA